MTIDRSTLSRRALLRTSLLGAAGLILPPGLACAGEPTPAQTEGPFHPLQPGPGGARIDARLRRFVDRDADLTFVDDRPGTAFGQVVEIDVQVVSAGGPQGDDAPLEAADVELWQACVSGRYNHRSDPSREWLDPAFQYWGRAITDAQGHARFRTIVPGAYAAGAGWVRPPHIHVKASAPGHRELTTQWYFAGARFYYQNRWWSPRALDDLNARDRVLGALPPERRAEVTSRLVAADEPEVLRARYALRLAPA